MATWASLDARLLRLLKDDGTQYASTLRIDGANSALEELVAHTADLKSQTITGDGTTTSWSLSSDILEVPDAIEAVWDNKRSDWLEEVNFVPGSDWTDSEPKAGSNPKGYYIWPTGTINYTRILATDETFKIYYYAYWSLIVDNNTTVSIPRWSEQALLYYAAAYCLLPASIQSATIRQFGTRQDSGNPEHNPVHAQADYFLKRYAAILASHQPQQRRLLYQPGRGL